MEESDVQAIVRQAIDEFTKTEQAKSEPAYKVELQEERRRREQLERRVNELIEENRTSQKVAEEAERGSAVRSELQRLGVTKVDLAFKAVQDDIIRSGDGRFVGRTEAGDVSVREYLAAFVNDNPEFLPARISGGTGMTAGQKAAVSSAGEIRLDRIRPGMRPEEMQRVREEIVRIATQTLKGA